MLWIHERNAGTYTCACIVRRLVVGIDVFISSLYNNSCITYHIFSSRSLVGFMLSTSPSSSARKRSANSKMEKVNVRVESCRNVDPYLALSPGPFSVCQLILYIDPLLCSSPVQGYTQDNLRSGQTLAEVLSNCIRNSTSALFTLCEWW